MDKSNDIRIVTLRYVAYRNRMYCVSIRNGWTLLTEETFRSVDKNASIVEGHREVTLYLICSRVPN